KDGFLRAQKVKSPIGPLRKVYSPTEAGGELLKFKVNKNFVDQLKFIENFLIELSSIYVLSFPDIETDEKIEDIRVLLKKTLENVIKNIPSSLDSESKKMEK
ncbi:MAG: hypothetical protein ACXABG_14125, partial [Promethearchaeota archaeon]